MNLKSVVLSALTLGGSLFAAPFASAENLGFTSSTDKGLLDYAQNEEMTFTITLVDRDNNNQPVTGRSLVWKRTGDDGATDSGTATSDTPLVIKTSSSVAGFVRIVVNYLDSSGAKVETAQHFFDGGAGADVWNIPEWPAPTDFEAFWATETARLAATAYVTNSFVCIKEDSNWNYYSFMISTFDGERPATGIAVWPKNAAAASLGIVAEANGYGNAARTSIPSTMAGYIHVALCRHGEDPYNADDNYYTEYQKTLSTDGKAYCWRNNDKTVQDTDYYKMLMRDLRSLQFVKSFPEWNGCYLKMSGGSMGGYQAIGCAALDPDVTECAAYIPWSVDLSGATKYGRLSGWRPDWTSNLDYVDLKNLAKLVTVPVSYTAGLGDYVCPPSGEILLYRNLNVKKSVTFVQCMGHGSENGVNSPRQSVSYTPVSRTLSFAATEGANWSTEANWTDTAGATNAVPVTSDALTFAEGTSSVNDLTDLEIRALTLPAGTATLSSSPAANPVVFAVSNTGLACPGTTTVTAPLHVRSRTFTADVAGSLVLQAPLARPSSRALTFTKTGAGKLTLAEGFSSSDLTDLAITAGSLDVTTDLTLDARLSLATGTQLTVAEGKTLSVRCLYADGTRIAAGTYTSATWLLGAGTVTVAETTAEHLTWCGGATTTNWSDPLNWLVSGTTDTHLVPMDGDTLTLGKDSTCNDIVNLAPYKIEFAGVYSIPSGNEVLIGPDAWGLYNPGYMYVAFPIRVTGDSIRIHCTSIAIHRDAIYRAAPDTFSIRKTGSGTLGFKNDYSTCKFTGLSRIDIEEGTVLLGIQASYTEVLKLPAGLIFNFTGTSGSLATEVSVTFPGMTIREGLVSGASHTINVKGNTLGISGTPADTRQVFTGKLIGTGTFKWAPDAADAEFCLSGSASTLSGTLQIDSGRFCLTNGASFTQLGTLAMKGASEKLVLDTGVILRTAAATVGGVALADGYYCTSGGLFGTRCDWIEGEGLLAVGTVDPIGESEASWTANGGATTSVTEPANWGEAGSKALPDLRFGGLTATFEAGAAAYLDRSVAMKGIVLDAANDFAFTAAAGATLTLGTNGLVTTGNGHVYSLGWPLALSGEQDWTIGAGDTLALADDLSLPGCVYLLGTAKLSVPAGKTLSVKRLYVDGVRVAPGTYTTADWLTGGGSVVLNGRRLVWCSGGTKLWSDSANWLIDGTETHAVPQDDDTIKLPTGGNASQNDLVNFSPYKIEFASSYSNPFGNEIIMRGDAWGFQNPGFMYVNFHTRVDGDSLRLHCTDSAYHCGAIYRTAPDTFYIRKTGGGTLGFRNDLEGCKFTGLTRIDIEEGTVLLGIQSSYAHVLKLPAGLIFNFTGTSGTLATEVSVTFPGMTIREGLVSGASHTINVKGNTLGISGTPADTRQVFTGKLIGTGTFKWAPDAADAEFCLSGSASTLSGTLQIDSGRFCLTNGASFTQLGTLAMKGASEKLVLDTGIVLRAQAATVGGVALADGCYGSPDGLAGTKCDWIEGEGVLYVGANDPQETAASWTANGGETTDVTEPANWGEAEATTLPDFVFGKMTATFSAGVASYLDRTVSFKGLVFDAPGDFAFTAAANAQAMIQAGGITTSGAGHTYAFGWPTLFAQAQTWSVGSGDTLAVSGDVTALADLTLAGNGRMDLSCVIDASTKVSADLTNLKLHLAGATINGNLVNSGTGSASLYVDADTDNVINGVLDASKDTAFGLSIGKGATLRLRDGLKRNYTAWFSIGGGGTLDLDGPVTMSASVPNSALALGDNTTVRFNAPSNQLGGVYFSIGGSNPRIETTVPYAFAAPAKWARLCGNPNGFVWDLCGCDQAITGVKLDKNSTIRSTESATVHFMTEDVNHISLTNSVIFAGKVNVSFEGTKALGLSGTSTSAGSLSVSKGLLDITPSGSWASASEAVVKGGVLRCSSQSALGRETDIRFTADSTGILDLAFDGSLFVGDLYFGDELQPAGSYGSTASGAQYQDDTRFSGTGVIVCGATAKVYSEGTSDQVSGVKGYTGITLDTPGAFDLTATADGRIILGSDGLTTTGNGNAYRLACPMSLAYNQTWTVAAGDTLTIAGGLAHSQGTLTINSAGSLVFEGENTFDQAINVTADSVTFRGTNAVGASSKAITVNARTASKATALTFDNATIDRPLSDPGSGSLLMTALAGTTNAVLGKFTRGPLTTTIKVNDGSVLRIAGESTQGYCGWVYFRGGSGAYGELHFDGALSWGGAAENCEGNVALYFNAKNNYLGSNWSEFNNQTRVYTTVAYAFSTNQNLDIRMGGMNANGFWDLCGCDQALAKFSTGANTTIRSTEAATLHLIPASDVTHAAKFVGKAGLSVEGTKTVTLTAESPTEGDLTVKSGVLALAAGARWPKAGTVSIQGGKLDLAEGVIQKCRQLKIGDTVYKKRGTWGSSESNAEHKDDEHFSGKGVVRVRGAALIVVFGH